MFFCGFCKKTTQPGETKTMIVTKTRTKEYPKRYGAGGGVHGDRERVVDQGGVGQEILEEKPACPACALKIQPPSSGYSNKPRFKRELDSDLTGEEARDA